MNDAELKQRSLGQYMTPDEIAKQMFSKFLIQLDKMYVLDPACGDGNLLSTVAKIMLEAGIKNIPSRLVGVDIDRAMLLKARKKLQNIIGCANGELKLMEGDFLEITSETLFNKVDFKKINAIISNPPYGSDREYKFFEVCDRFFNKDVEKVFLMPLAFIDRVTDISYTILDGRPLGVTTGHAIIHHKCGHSYKIKKVKTHQTNTTEFSVLTGIKIYSKGSGTPPQTSGIVENKPFSSTVPKPGWLSCLRTGDIKPYQITLGRLYINYGPHLAHPKELARFKGPKLFVRRVPIWKDRTLGVAYSDQTILCAGDVLVIRHKSNNVELLKGLGAFLNTKEAAEFLYKIRPTVLHRTSFPKISAKDLNKLLDAILPSENKLRLFSQNLPPVDFLVKSENNSYLEEDFPISEVSEACSKEKSI